jgi:hypothetical protein
MSVAMLFPQVWRCGAVAAIAVALQFAQAGGMRMSAALDVKVHKAQFTFERSTDRPGEGWLYLTRGVQDVEFDLRLKMSGEDPVVQKGRSEANEVPGVTAGVTGFKRARLETFGKDVTLVVETDIVRTKQKDGNDVQEKEQETLRLPLRFKDRSGSLEAIRAGKTVELQITSAGLKQLREGASAKGKAGVGMSAEGDGVKVSGSASATFLRASHRGRVFAGPDRIEYEPPPMHVHAEGSVRVDEP